MTLLVSSLRAQTLAYDDINFSKGSFFGGVRNDSYLLHMAMDADGNIYGTGFCTDIPTTTGCYQRNCAGQYDVMVFKMDPTMTTLLWATYIGGSDIDAGGSIAVNAAGEVFIGGYTYSKNFPSTNPSDAKYLNNGQIAAFSLKLSANGGRLLYSRILGNAAPIQQQSQNASKETLLCLNPSGETYVLTTIPSGAPFNITANAFQRNPAGGFDLALTKLDANGSTVYSTYIGGSGADVARDICYAAGKVYLCGTTNSTNFPRNATRAPQSVDAFVMVVDDIATPRIRKSFVYGSTGNDVGSAVFFDGRSRRLLLAGTSEYANIGSTTILQTGQTTGGFVASIDTGLTRMQSLTMVGSGITPTSIAVRSNGSAFIAGYVLGSLPISANAFQSSGRGDLDGLLVELDSSLSKSRYGTYIGGSGPDYSAAKVMLYEHGCVTRIVFGITTHSTNFPSSLDSYQPLKGNGPEDQGAMVLFSSMNDLKLQSTIHSCTRECTFKVDAKCPPTEVVWDFGDSSQSVHSNAVPNIVTHVYAANGVYRVRAKLVYEKPDTALLMRDVVFNAGYGVQAGPDIDLCSANMTVQLQARGAVKYWWSNGKQFKDSTLPVQEVHPTTTTSYIVHGLDTAGCESVDTVTVRLVNLKATISRDTSLCLGQSARLAVQTTGNVQWAATQGIVSIQGAAIVVAPTSDQVYEAVVHQGSCADTLRVRVRMSKAAHVTMPSSPLLCAQHAYRLQPSVYDKYPGDTAGLRIQWSPSQFLDQPNVISPLVSVTQNTTLYLRVTNRLGCVTTDSIKLRVQAAPSLSAIADTVLCDGQSLRLWVKGSSSVRWSPSTGLSSTTSTTPLCTASATTTYTVIAANGQCADTVRVTVRVGSRPSVKALGDTTVCAGDRICLRVQHAESGVRYLWSPGADFEDPQGDIVYAHPQTNRTYTVVALGSAGCTSSSTVQVRINNNLSVAALQDSSVCEGERTTLHIQGGMQKNVSYTWTPNDGQFDLSKGIYHVVSQRSKVYTLHASRGHCTATTQIPLTYKAKPNVVFPNDTLVCEYDAPELRIRELESGLHIKWTDSSMSNSISGSTTNATVNLRSLNSTRTLHVDVEKNGCVIGKNITVRIQKPPVIQLPPEQELCPGQRVLLHVNAPSGSTVHWSPTLGLSSSLGADVIASPSRTTVYQVQVFDKLGCSTTQELRVLVRTPRSLNFRIHAVKDEVSDSTMLVVEAQSDSLLRSTLNFDILCDADAFEPTHDYPQSIVQGVRRVHCSLQSQTLGVQSRQLLSLKGTLLLAHQKSSVISVAQVDADATLCPRITTEPGVLELSSCYFSGRHVQYKNPLSVRLYPQPVDDIVALEQLGQNDSSNTASSPLEIEVLDLGARCVLRNSLKAKSHHDEVQHLDCSMLSPGVYQMKVKQGTEEQLIPFIKR